METNIIDIGCRTFALALGKSHATVSRLLPVLKEASAGILTRIDRARGRNADTYAVQLPEHFQQLARELTWRKRKIHASLPSSGSSETSQLSPTKRSNADATPPPPRTSAAPPVSPAAPSPTT
ncbi:hypothetical protein [Arthrobacter agilis]|nr:hypothetical protein [Arthrobacter agilis]